MIPRHKIFHIALFLLIFLKFLGSSFEESMNYEHIKKSFIVNKTLGCSDKDFKTKSLYVSDKHYVDFILKRTSVENHLHLFSSNLIPKNLIPLSSRLLL